VNPSLLAQYADCVWGDLGFLAAEGAQGGSRGQYLAAALNVVQQHYIGIALNRRESPLYNVDAGTPARDPVQEMNRMVASVLGIGAQPYSRPLSPVELFWCLQLDSGAVGASLTYGRWSGERSGNGESRQSASTLRAKAGLAFRVTTDLLLDGGVLAGLNAMSGTATPASGPKSELSMTGGIELGADVRLKANLDKRWSVVPVARWYSFSWGMKQVRNGILVIPDPAAEYSHSEIEAGAGVNFAREGLLLVGGLSLQRISTVSDYRTSKTTTTTTDIPKINLGAEFALATWLTGRIGYFDRLSSSETTSQSGASKSKSTTSTELPWYGYLNGLTAAQQRITIGIGLHLGGVSLDGTIGEGYFLNGPWPLSGSAQSVFSVLSLNYRFD